MNVNSVLRKINIRDILFIEALGDYLSINTIIGKYTVRSMMKNIFNKLPENDFMRVHNSYIVRLDKVTSIDGNSLSMNERIIPISRSKQNDLMNGIKLL